MQAGIISVKDIFKDFYSVPSYQRGYVWKKEHVEQLVHDFHQACTEGDDDYFIGSMILCEADDSYDVIDGQQRMTTLLLFFCALKDALINAGVSVEMRDHLSKSIADTEIIKGRLRHKPRVSLNYRDSKDAVDDVLSGDFRSAYKNDKRIADAYRYAFDEVRALCGDDESSLLQMWEYVMSSVKVTRIVTDSALDALRVFETINDRGVGLDASDLIKNQVLMSADEDEYEDLSTRWREMMNELQSVKEKRVMRFVRYFLSADYPKGIMFTEASAYKYFLANSESIGYKRDPKAFVNSLLRGSKCYSGFLKGQDTEGSEHPSLGNLVYLRSYQHLMPLMASRHMEEDAFGIMARAIENLYFSYVVTNTNTKDFQLLFGKWAKGLKRIRYKDEAELFVESNVNDVLHSMKNKFADAMLQMNVLKFGKKRSRYMLFKIAQYVDSRVSGLRHPRKSVHEYLNKMEVEHIMPVEASERYRSLFSSDDEFGVYLNKLGNVTPLERSLNASAQNDDFDEKKSLYTSSTSWLTKTIDCVPDVGLDTQYKRAFEELELVSYDKWGPESIDSRQEDLAKLAFKVWGFPA